MNEQAIFEYLKENLEIRLDSKTFYRPDATCYSFELWLTNPATKEQEKISKSEDFAIDGSET
jgi:hypothetical protein